MRVNYEPPKQRVATFDSKGHRIEIFPAQVRGFFRKNRTWVESVLLAIFFVFPWIQVKGSPAIFLDVAKREFHLFGSNLWATDAPLMLFILASFFCLLMAVTALWGRIWCGWACPQTVLIDLVYRRIEEWIEGDSRQRRMLQQDPWSLAKITKKVSKWLLYVLISIFLAHSFLAYFVSWRGWSQNYANGFQGSTSTLVMLILCTIVFLFDFGWFREQFCIVACPYGRWQSVWLDEKSMIIGYNSRRGEPRRGVAQPAMQAGDCVSCYRCVQVCPTGIDIRRGLQMECIACSACIDACDEVMVALGKSPGLIRYTSQAQDESSSERNKPFQLQWRARPIIYIAVVALLMSGFGAALYFRSPISATLHRTQGPPYLSAVLPSGETETVNSFQMAIRNQLSEPVLISIEVLNQPDMVLAGETLAQPFQPGEQKRLLILAKLKSAPGLKYIPGREIHFKVTIEGQSTHRTFSDTRGIRFLTPS